MADLAAIGSGSEGDLYSHLMEGVKDDGERNKIGTALGTKKRE